MEISWKEIVSSLSDIATILAFLWAIYEFYIKKRFKIKATASPSPINLKLTEYIFDFKVINLSEQSLKRIEYIGIWIIQKNSFGQFWEIKLQDVGYQEKTTFSQDIFPFLISAIEQCLYEQTWIEKLFKPKLKIVLKTTTEREIKVDIDEFFQKQVNEKITQLFNSTNQRINPRGIKNDL